MTVPDDLQRHRRALSHRTGGGRDGRHQQQRKAKQNAADLNHPPVRLWNGDLRPDQPHARSLPRRMSADVGTPDWAA